MVINWGDSIAKYCQDCGTELRENAKFCEGCGRKILSQKEYEKEIEKKYRKELEEKIRKEIEEEKRNQYIGYRSHINNNKTIGTIIGISIILSLLFIVLFAVFGAYEFNNIYRFKSNIATKTGFPLDIFTFKPIENSIGSKSTMEIDFLALIIDLLFFIVILAIILIAVDFIYYKIKSRNIWGRKKWV